jgi:hypothetical protein
VLVTGSDVTAVRVCQRPVRLDARPIEAENEGTPLHIMAKEEPAE